jgi:exodeoxyribonuclease V alpha subunit
MHDIMVDNVLWSGPHGKAIFNAITLTGEKYRMVAGANVMARIPLTGEVWEIHGTVKIDPKYGRQVVVSKALLRKPSGQFIKATIAGSKLFPGIGRAGADKIWDTFGEDIYSLLETGDYTSFVSVLKSELLARVLISGWQALAAEADVCHWLDNHGLPAWLATKLLAIYGNTVIERLNENPYRLLALTSWHHVDNVGRAIGVVPDDPRRLVGAVDASVYQRLGLAHTVTGFKEFGAIVDSYLGGSMKMAQEAINLGLQCRAIERVTEDIQGLGPFAMEAYIADRAIKMAKGDFNDPEQRTLRIPSTDESLNDVYAAFAQKQGFPLNKEQRDAVCLAMTKQIVCIIGGAGVGKTTVLSAIILAAERLGFGGVYLMALSGRAAKRITESTGRKAFTIVGFLNAVAQEKIDLTRKPLIVVDEASMLDLPYCYRIMRLMFPGYHFVLTGDAAQLPPIGFGLTFHTMCTYPVIPTVELTQIHRQAAITRIPQISVAIRNGIVPELSPYGGKGVGVSFIECATSAIVERVLDVVNDLGGVRECQIIGAVKSASETKAGTRRINAIFHELLTVAKVRCHGYAAGEPVIWTVNNYEKELLNGSLGVVKSAEDGLVVEFDGKEHTFAHGEEKEMELAYAITVHKSQGSQFERVIVPVFPSRLLDRTLLYTAITRAKSQVVLIGSRSAFDVAVRAEPAPSRRRSGLKFHLDRCVDLQL